MNPSSKPQQGAGSDAFSIGRGQRDVSRPETITHDFGQGKGRVTDKRFRVRRKPRA